MSSGKWWTNLLKKPNLEDKDHLIAVVGVPKAGKSTFIHRAVGQNDLKTSGTGDSCMAGIPCCTYKQNGKKITLLDTPGFDDASRSSAEILENIANFLSGIGDQGIYLSGIILLQPIQGVEMQGSEKKLIRLIEDVVGKDNFERVILATTQWNKLKSKKEGLSKQEKWKAEKNCWGGMVEHGAQVVKHDDNKSSARKIVGMILDIKTPPAPLQLQLELAANQFAIASTTAGIRIMEELDKSTKNLVGKLNLAREKQSETVNGHGSQLQDEVDNLQDKFKKLQDEINNLQDGIDNQQKQREKLKSAKVDYGKVLVRAIKLGGEFLLCAMS